MSVLDARIRLLAREEAAALAGTPAGEETATAPDQEQITELRERLDAATTTISGLEERIDALEKAATQTSTPARRASRKSDTLPE